jgi:hypothetical protein
VPAAERLREKMEISGRQASPKKFGFPCATSLSSHSDAVILGESVSIRKSKKKREERKKNE